LLGIELRMPKPVFSSQSTKLQSTVDASMDMFIAKTGNCWVAGSNPGVTEHVASFSHKIVHCWLLQSSSSLRIAKISVLTLYKTKQSTETQNSCHALFPTTNNFVSFYRFQSNTANFKLFKDTTQVISFKRFSSFPPS
jgi:hypothetical protein